MNKQLIFIYNANSGAANVLLDVAHKILKPSTYSCNLCELTFGLFAERKIWKAFRKNLEQKNFNLEFLHRDEFLKTYKSKFGYKFTFPIILIVESSGLEILIDTPELNAIEDENELIKIIKARI